MSTNSALIARLEDAVGSASVITDSDIIATNSTDRANFCESGHALVLVRPATVDEVSAVIRIAGDARIPIVPQGALTGLSGGANAVDNRSEEHTSELQSLMRISYAVFCLKKKKKNKKNTTHKNTQY